MTDAYSELNDSLRDWSRLQVRALKGQVHRLALKDRRSLQKRLQYAVSNPDEKSLAESTGFSVGKSFGQIERVNFRFQRHGIFYERGRFGAGRKGSRQREAKPWIAPVLDPAISSLADLLVERYADIIQGEIKFTVPGVLNRRIRIDNG